MQNKDLTDKEVLRSIDTHLKALKPLDFNESSPVEQRAIWAQMLDEMPLGVAVALEETHSDLVAMRQEREAKLVADHLAYAKLAGAKPGNLAEHIAKQFEVILP